ncbi:MAG: hypothetical protein MR668_01500 [Collinsella sp.]|nr:hypothetical protein [Collinsella sp.]
MARKVFIARNRSTGFHSLVEVVRGVEAAEKSAPMDFELAERLMRWGTLDELVTAISESGPLIDRSIYKEENRRLSIDEAIEVVEESVGGERGFTRCDEDFLYLQLCLEGVSTTGSASSLYPSQASITRDLNRHGLIESNGLDELKKWQEEDPYCVVVIEPLRDVVLCRNLGSVLLRLIANIKAGYDDVLERSGFKRFEKKRRWWITGELKDSYYVLPFQHNSSFDMTLNYSTKWFKNVFSYMVINPLETRILDLRPKKDKVLFGSVPNAVLITAQIKTGEGAPFFDIGWKPEVEKTQLYLGIDDEGAQRDEAIAFVESVAKMLAGLTTKDGDPLGWSVGEPSIFDDEPAPRYHFHSTAAAMFGSIFYRYGCVPATCKNCGNGILVKTRGKRREFCSPSCRTQYSNRKAGL